MPRVRTVMLADLALAQVGQKANVVRDSLHILADETFKMKAKSRLLLRIY